LIVWYWYHWYWCDITDIDIHGIDTTHTDIIIW
jgi:hypothetical protein